LEVAVLAVRKLYGDRGSGKRWVWIAVALVVLLIIPTVMTVRTVEKQRFDGVRINLAGRQRMLTQKLCMEILLFAQGRMSARRVRRTMRVFETTLYALLRGGQAPLDLRLASYRALPRMKDTSIRAQLQRVVALWRPFARRVEDYLAKRNEDALEHVIRTNVGLLAEMDRSVSMMQKRSEKNSAVVSGVLLGTVLAALLLLGFLLLRKVLELRTASVHIQRLETLLPICASCKNIRPHESGGAKQSGSDDSAAAWVSIEQYLHDEESMEFTHSICPDCREKLYPTSRSRSS
jgi:nitrate/nitrite-specific signal transduction histidine kinase